MKYLFSSCHVDFCFKQPPIVAAAVRVCDRWLALWCAFVEPQEGTNLILCPYSKLLLVWAASCYLQIEPSVIIDQTQYNLHVCTVLGVLSHCA